jgi:hypothetical protein
LPHGRYAEVPKAMGHSHETVSVPEWYRIS